MRRCDWFWLLCFVFNGYIVIRMLTLLSVGAGISLMGEKGVIGYGVIASFSIITLVIVSNIASLVRVVLQEEDVVTLVVRKVAQLSLIPLFLIVALEALSAFSIYTQYYAG